MKTEITDLESGRVNLEDSLLHFESLVQLIPQRSDKAAFSEAQTILVTEISRLAAMYLVEDANTIIETRGKNCIAEFEAGNTESAVQGYRNLLRTHDCLDQIFSGKVDPIDPELVIKAAFHLHVFKVED